MKYETVLIITPSSEKIKLTTLEYINYFIINKANLMFEEHWGLKKLAYPIRKRKYGCYHIFYYSALEIETKPENKYCFFKKNNIKYIDFKNPSFLIKFLNERGEILPRKITGTSKKFQKKVKRAIKKCKYIGLLPYLKDRLR